MPERRSSPEHDRAPESSERLDRAIDRLIAGAPLSRLDDPELDALLRVAERLRRELPGTLPEPASG